MIYKKDFPIFNNAFYKEQDLIYLDNAATTQKPQQVLDALQHYYTHMNSNVGRSVYHLAEVSQNAFENSRKKVANFIKTKNKNIVFTSGATASINMVSHFLKQHEFAAQKNKIVLSIVEHHANILPWQRFAREKGFDIVFINNSDKLANPETLGEAFWSSVAIVALTHVSNVTGQIHPVKAWSQLCDKYGAISVIDGAQGVTTTEVNVEDIGCDFYAFSAHKLYGPMGLGVLYINKKWLYQFEPPILGGGIIEDVTVDNFYLLDDTARYEAGTPNVANVFALGAALDYLEENNWAQTLEETHNVGEYLLDSIASHPELNLLSLDNNDVLGQSHIASFTINDIHAHDAGTFLSDKNVAVRVGKHCTHPLHSFLNTPSSIRASIGIYNTKHDVDMLINALNACIIFFRKT